jgi:two-component system alkaline phosphatase synthesis response regulator PhoP
MKRVLVIEDDVDLLTGLKDNLEVEGYEVVTAADGEEGLAKAIRSNPSAIILDLMLPGLNGFDICRSLNERGVAVPILMLTARSDDTDKVLGLELGADDYVTKPFNIHELLARIRAMIRRASGGRSAAECLTIGEVKIDLRHQRAQKGHRTISLSSLECDVLRHLTARQGEIVSRDQLLKTVWGYQTSCTTRSVDNLIGRLRQKIELDPHKPLHILTVHGTGYRFVA